MNKLKTIHGINKKIKHWKLYEKICSTRIKKLEDLLYYLILSLSDDELLEYGEAMGYIKNE